MKTTLKDKSFFVALGIMALVLCPYFVFGFKGLFFNWPFNLAFLAESLPVLKWTFLQSGLTAFVSVGFGVLGAMGLLGFSARGRKWLEFLCLLPALMPPLVCVLAFINVAEVVFRFPFSFSAVVGVHILINVGLSSVFLARVLKSKGYQLSQYAFLHGVKRLSFLKKMLFLECRADLILLILLIFAFCWTSFSVPLLVGGASGQTLQVFIAEQLKTPSKWPLALSLLSLETLFIFILFGLIYRGGNTLPSTQGIALNGVGQVNGAGQVAPKDKPLGHRLKFPRRLYVIPFQPFIVLPLIPTGLVLIGLMGQGLSLTSLQELWAIRALVAKSLGQSLLLGLGTGALVFGLLSLVVFCLRHLFLQRFLVAYTCSSTAFMGFTFLLIGGDGFFMVWLKWCVGLSLLFLPALWRLMGESGLRGLHWQAKAGGLMGASPWGIFVKVLYPQMWGQIWLLSGVGAFWAVGDFAFSSIVSGEGGHLALLIQDLLFSHRLELATTLTWLLLLCGTFCFFVFYRSSFKPLRLLWGFSPSNLLRAGAPKP